MSWSVARSRAATTHPWGIQSPTGERCWRARTAEAANQLAVAMAGVDLLLARIRLHTVTLENRPNAVDLDEPAPIDLTTTGLPRYGLYAVPGHHA